MLQFWRTLADNVVFLMFLLPLVGACLVLASSRLGLQTIRRTALTNVLLTFTLSVLMVGHYDAQKQSDSGRPQLFQMITVVRWLGEQKPVEIRKSGPDGDTRMVVEQDANTPDVLIALGVDGISLWFVALTAVLMIPAIVAGEGVDRQHPAAFYALLLLLQSALIGLFAALDVIFFSVCLEFTLVPLLFLIGRWGGYERRRVLGKLFISQLAGSLLVLFGLTAVVLAYSSMIKLVDPSQSPPRLMFTIPILIQGIPELVASNASAARYWTQASPWMCLALLAGFAITIPVFPLHTWFTTANVEAPTAVSMLFSGVVLKVAGYGILRFLLPLFPEIIRDLADVLVTLAIFGVVYAGLMTLAQDDIKKLAGWSCISQIGLCVAGLFSLNAVGVTGGLLQLINHGLSIGAVLFLIGVLERRYRTREIEAFGGLANRLPRFRSCFVFAALAVVGAPGLNGFAGELMTLLGIFQGNPRGPNWPVAAFWGLIGSLLVAWAFLGLIQKTFREGEAFAEPTRGPSDPPQHTGREDLTNHELAVLIPLAVLIVWIGIYPQFFVSRMEPSVSQILSGYRASDVQEESTQR